MWRGPESPVGPSPEHVADPEHVALPGALATHGHGGHRLQPHEASSPLQPTVVTGHHLPLVQHWAQPRGRRRQSETGGQEHGAEGGGRTREGDSREETRATVQRGRWKKTESGGLSISWAQGPSGFLRGGAQRDNTAPFYVPHL